MLPFLIPTLILSKYADEKLRQSLPPWGAPWERDGFLLGIDTLGRHYVIDATLPDSRGNDGAADEPSSHTEQIRTFFEKYDHDRLSIVGIWRSLPCGAKENRIVEPSREKGGESGYCISFSPSPHGQEWMLSACYVDLRGKLHPCRVVVESEKYKIPRRYFKLRKKNNNGEPFL